MYQCYVVQEFNGVPYNVVLGYDFKTTDEAMKAINMYEKHFGKCEIGYIQPTGTEIPKGEKKKKTKKDYWKKFVAFITGEEN